MVFAMNVRNACMHSYPGMPSGEGMLPIIVSSPISPRYEICTQTLNIVYCWHIHRDLKPENVLLKHEPSVQHLGGMVRDVRH